MSTRADRQVREIRVGEHDERRELMRKAYAGDEHAQWRVRELYGLSIWDLRRLRGTWE